MENKDTVMRIYKPVKRETKVKGYWKDNGGKVLFDYIDIVQVNTFGEFQYNIINLFKLGEQAIFYKGIDKAFILSKDGTRKKLENKKDIIRKELTENEREALIDYYGGITVHQRKNDYLIEVWY